MELCTPCNHTFSTPDAFIYMIFFFIALVSMMSDHNDEELKQEKKLQFYLQGQDWYT